MEGTTHFQKGRGRTPLAKGKEQERTVRSLQDNRRIAGQGHSRDRTKDIQILLDRETTRRQVWQRWKSNYAGALVWNRQTETPVASSVTSSEPQTETSTMVGTIDTIECTALDLCATSIAQQEVVNPRWIAFNADTGAAGTVCTMNADYACEKVSCPADRNYKTATGEMVEGKGRFRVRCQSF